MGVDIAKVHSALLSKLIANPAPVTAGHIPFTPPAKKVLELSLREALQLGHTYIGTEHLLLGMIREGEGVAAHVLTVDVGLDVAAVRTNIVDYLRTQTPPSTPEIQPAPPVKPATKENNRALILAAIQHIEKGESAAAVAILKSVYNEML